MKKLNYEKLNAFIGSDVIQPFYKIRLERLEFAKLANIAKRKNPYLFKAKNIETAGDLAKGLLDAFLSSQEETIFGDLMESLAVHVCQEIFNGKKAEQGKYRSVDLIFEKDGKTYIVGIKSGPNWGNSDQVNIMRRNFKKAKALIRTEWGKKNLVSVNGCMYGKDNVPHKVNKDPDLSYYKICGQAFWELISDNERLYLEIVKPLNHEARKRSEEFQKEYLRVLSEFVIEFQWDFCDGIIINWEKLVKFNSGKRS